REILLRANVTRGRRLVCYDGSGIAAAKLAFVLALLGHDDVAVYDGGWAEWGNRLDLPVDR
ncbi:MAG: sulfurtransferase, partial [Chloroflexi bacterium]|nr:sulfurtransferase [Chloroflexota bacterium]